MKNKTIIIFTGFYYPHMGGVERYTNKVAEELKNNGNNVIIITTNHDNLPSEEIIDNIKIYRLSSKKIFKQRFPFIKKDDIYDNIINNLNNINIDFIICNTRFYSTTKLAYKYANKRSIPIVCIEHGSNYMSVNNLFLDSLGHIYEQIISRKIKKRVDGFYGVSKKSSDWLKTFGIKANGVFYNSVDGDSYNKFKGKSLVKKSKNQTIILYSGRVIKEKRVDLLLDVFKEIKTNYNNLSLYIAGEGDCLNKYKQEYIDKDIHFVGNLPYEKIMSLYNQADIFVHPSDYPEGLPTVLLEAGIMKCALIATDRGGTNEVLCNNENGLIIEPNFNDLKEKLCSLLDDKKLLKHYQEKAYENISENFTWETTTKIIIEELNKLDNMRIYIASHKNIEFPKQNIYKPIRVGSAISDDDFGFIRDDSGENISKKNKNYCELTATYWVMNNNEYDITGLVHYRRYFIKHFKKIDFNNAINRNYIKKILSKYDIIVPNTTIIIKHNNEKSWAYDHNKKDYDLVRNIITELYPDYIDAFNEFSKRKTLYICNMFISNRKIFNDYYNWLFNILFELEKRTDISQYDDYNKRLYGFMSERLFNVWLIKHRELRVKRVPVYNINKKIKNQYFMIN